MKKCSRCGACCEDLQVVTQEEIDEMRKYIGKHPRIMRKVADPPSCPFLRKCLWFKRCAVYRVRPAICRTYSCKEPLDQLVMRWNEKGIKAAPRSIYASIVGDWIPLDHK